MAKKYPSIADDRRQPLVPRTGIIVPRNGGWSGDNQLGYQAKYAPDARGTQTILKLDEWGPPEIWTVSLYLLQKFQTFNGFAIKARLNFGAGGSTQIVEMDWLNGSQISLPMNALNVMALFDDVDVATEGAGLTLGVQISRGPRGGDSYPTNTVAEFIEANNTAHPTFAGIFGDVYALPAFAKNVVLMPCDQVSFATFYTADTRMTLLSGNTAGIITTASIDGTRAVGGLLRLPVSGQARFINVRYAGGGLLPRYSLYAELAG